MAAPSRQDRQRARQAEQRRRAQTARAVVGVDAGKFQHALVVRPAGGVDSKAFLFPTTRAGFDAAVERILGLSDGALPQEVLVGIEFAGVYGFTLAHYLNQLGFQVVSVLPADTKAWKQVRHHQRLKTDSKDAATIADLAASGNYVDFPFLEPAYAELRYMVSARERLSLLRNGALSRLKSTLQIVFPEFESLFASIQNPTPMALLAAFPGPEEIRAAPKRKVMAVLRKASRNHLGEDTYERLLAAAESTLALPGALSSLKREVRLLLEQIELYRNHIHALEEAMTEVMRELPEAECLLSIPGVAPVSAAIFLGSIGDPQAYQSSRQILRLAGMNLIEDSSGIRQGKARLSKAGRPLLRRQAFMLGLRAVRRDGIYRARFGAMIARNGNRKMPAVVAVGRQMLRLMYSVARERRLYTPKPPERMPVEQVPATV